MSVKLEDLEIDMDKVLAKNKKKREMEKILGLDQEKQSEHFKIVKSTE